MGVQNSLKTLALMLVAMVPAEGGPAFSKDGVGEALAVIDNASTSGEVGERTLAVGMEVFLYDRVKTDAGGQAQLLFNDGTRMVVGPNSELMLDTFIFRSGAKDNQFTIRALNGAFRFITGDAQKDAYLIHTPSATIGVRGTIFDFSVTPGETSLLLLHGGATVCGNDGKCTLADVSD